MNLELSVIDKDSGFIVKKKNLFRFCTTLQREIKFFKSSGIWKKL